MDTVETGSASFPGISQPEIVVGLLASPGPAAELTESLLPEIAGRLPERLPGARWRLATSGLTLHGRRIGGLGT